MVEIDSSCDRLFGCKCLICTSNEPTKVHLHKYIRPYYVWLGKLRPTSPPTRNILAQTGDIHQENLKNVFSATVGGVSLLFQSYRMIYFLPALENAIRPEALAYSYVQRFAYVYPGMWISFKVAISSVRLARS